MYEHFVIDIENAVFEWDEGKDKINFQKHGIRFATASRAFSDPDKLIREDYKHPQEQRFDVLGKVRNVLFVVCTFRKGNVIRLISARQATAYEKEIYEYGEDAF